MEVHDGTVTTQPKSLKSGSTPGRITIRNMLDSDEDCQFAGRLTVLAFKDVYTHATSAGSLPDLAVALGHEFRGQESLFYERNIIGEIDGEKAGHMSIAFHEDPDTVSGNSFDTILGCADMAGMACLRSVMREEVQKSQCLIHHVCVDISVRRKGVASALLEWAEKESRRKGCHAIYTWLSSRNRAGRSLYSYHGYSVEDRTSKCCCGLWCAIGICRAVKMVKTL